LDQKVDQSEIRDWETTQSNGVVKYTTIHNIASVWFFSIIEYSLKISLEWEFTIQNVNYIQISRDKISENEQFIVDEKFLFILEKGIKKAGQWAAQLGQINQRQIKSVTEVRKNKYIYI